MDHLQNILKRLQERLDTPIYTDMSADEHTVQLCEKARRHALELSIDIVKHEIAIMELENSFAEFHKLIDN